MLGDFYLKQENNFHLRDRTSEVATHITRVRKRVCDRGIQDFHLEGMFLPLKSQLAGRFDVGKYGEF